MPALIGSFMMLIFYMYIYLTKTSLDIFNCNSTTPPDGHTYGPPECFLRGSLPCCLVARGSPPPPPPPLPPPRREIVGWVAWYPTVAVK